VSRNQDAPPLFRQLADQALEELRARPVHADEGLVEEQHGRVLDERARHEHALPLTTRERPERTVRELGEADALECHAAQPPPRATQRPPPRNPCERSHQSDVERRDRVVEARPFRLGHEATAALDPEPSGRGREQAEQHAEERRLASSVRSEHPDPLPPLKGETHVLEHHA
jgi:hypothetical protein